MEKRNYFKYYSNFIKWIIIAVVLMLTFMSCVTTYALDDKMYDSIPINSDNSEGEMKSAILLESDDDLYKAYLVQLPYGTYKIKFYGGSYNEFSLPDDGGMPPFPGGDDFPFPGGDDFPFPFPGGEDASTSFTSVILIPKS